MFGRDGRVRHRRGVTDVPGLYFLGLSWQHTRGSALIGWVKDDAEFIAEQIDASRERAASQAEAPPARRRPRPKEPDLTSTAMTPHREPLPDRDRGPARGRRPTEVVELADGDEFELRIAPVAKRIGDATVRMLAYNGSIPGPTLAVQEGSEIVVNVVNEGDLEATVHWHGLRLENRYDGTHETQAPIPVGGSFTYRVEFPDPGVYWYHPHIREDYGQEMGLYGNILVVPADPDYWPPAHRELALTLDDVLLEDGRIAPFSRAETTYAAMGRFGNVLLIGGETDLAGAQRGEVVRFYLTNTANTRVFNVALPGARMKLVGGDSGRYEHEEFVDESSSPRRSAWSSMSCSTSRGADARAPHPERTYPLATIDVSDERGSLPSMRAVRRSPHQRRHGRRARAARRPTSTPSPTRRSPSSPRWTWACRRGRRLRLPDAPRGRPRRARALPEVRDEAAAGRRSGDQLHLPDAPRGGERRARPLPEVRDEAPAGAAHGSTREPNTATRTATHDHEAHGATGDGRRDRVGGRHGRGQPDDDPGQHALEARRPRERRREPRDRLAVPRSATRSRSGCSTRWTPTTRCTTRSTSTAPGASWC